MTDEEIIAYWRGAYDRMAARSIEDGAKIASLEEARAEQWRLRRDMEASLDTALASIATLEAENERLRKALEGLLAAHDIHSVRGDLLADVIASAKKRARAALEASR